MEDFYCSWEADGFKATSTTGMAVDGNEVYDNRGNGMWCDVGCKDVTYSNNRIHHNARRGIHYEISSGGTIFDNAAWENGWATLNRTNGAGIGVSNSTDTEVYGNTLAWNADGIGITGLDRNGTDHDLVLNIYVHHNTILMQDLPSEDPTNHFALGWISGLSPQMFDPASNNRGEPTGTGTPIPRAARCASSGRRPVTPSWRTSMRRRVRRTAGTWPEARRTPWWPRRASRLTPNRTSSREPLSAKTRPAR
jgi:parallel beta-helix repeat protein